MAAICCWCPPPPPITKHLATPLLETYDKINFVICSKLQTIECVLDLLPYCIQFEVGGVIELLANGCICDCRCHLKVGLLKTVTWPHVI